MSHSVSFHILLVLQFILVVYAVISLIIIIYLVVFVLSINLSNFS